MGTEEIRGSIVRHRGKWQFEAKEVYEFDIEPDAIRAKEIYIDCMIDKLPIENFSHSGTYGFLSNFWPVQVDLDGILYKSVEHAFQASKTIDPVERERIRDTFYPSEAKRLGKQVTLRPHWDDFRLVSMRLLLA